MRLKFDTHSIKFRICLYFIVFAVVLMTLLWFLQVMFLNTFYKSMKTAKTEQIVTSIKKEYKNQEIDMTQFVDHVSEVSESNDLYICLTDSDNRPFFISNRDNINQDYTGEMENLRLYMESTNNTSVSRILDTQTSRTTLAFASILSGEDKPVIVSYVFSPLYPTASTINILMIMLLYVTVISLILALILSFYLATRITTPIRSITKSAAKLAQGNYGITFKGGQYTELIDLSDTLNKASIALEKSAMLQKDLIANVSHDLRTPLTMVKSYAEMVQDLSGDDKEKRTAHLQVIIDEADRLNVLVGDMLTLSRMQSGGLVLDKVRFRIKDVIEGILQTYKLLMEEDGYRIILECRNDITVIADAKRIEQVFANLVNNALKFCGPDKTVLITIKRRGRSVMCQVTDHGVGIPPEELPHIWERYYKASSNMVRPMTGSGLGLSIIKEILSLHKSNFGVTSTVGEGTTFWFELESGGR